MAARWFKTRLASNGREGHCRGVRIEKGAEWVRQARKTEFNCAAS